MPDRGHLIQVETLGTIPDEAGLIDILRRETAGEARAHIDFRAQRRRGPTCSVHVAHRTAIEALAGDAGARRIVQLALRVLESSRA